MRLGGTLLVICVTGLLKMKSPRIQVSLPQDVYDALRRFCALADCSMSSYVSELVTTTAPVICSLSDQLAHAESLRNDALIEMASRWQGAAEKLNDGLNDALSEMTGFSSTCPTLAPRGATAPKGCEGEGLGAEKIGSTPMSLTGGSGKTKNKQAPNVSSKNHLWLASSNEGDE